MVKSVEAVSVPGDEDTGGLVVSDGGVVDIVGLLVPPLPPPQATSTRAHRMYRSRLVMMDFLSIRNL